MSTSLSRTTASVRRFVLFGIIAIVAIYIVQSTTHFLDPIIWPTPSVRPSGTTVVSNCPATKLTFGQIPKLKLSSYTLAANTRAKFSTDTTNFPTFPTSLTVYKLDKMYEKLDDVDRARATALALGFRTSSEVGGDTSISWQSTDENKTFTFDKSNHSWNLITNLNNTSLTLLDSSINSYSSVVNTIQNTVDLSNTNYTNYEVEYRYVLRKFDKTLESIEQINKANILNIDYYKTVQAITCKDKDGKTVITRSRIVAPDYKDQSYTVQLTGLGKNLQTDMLSLKVREFEFSTTTGIYPTITYDEAYAMLEENKGVLYWILPEDGDIYATYQPLKIEEFVINIANIKIVYVEPQKYLDNDTSTQYIQPYYQFSGKATTNTDQIVDFIFLVPALQSTSYS